MKLSGFILILTAALVICSCGGRHTAGGHQGSGTGAIDSVSVINPKYAQGFKVKYLDDMVLLDISDPENCEAERFRFALTDKDFSGEIPEGYSRLDIPVETAICLTSLQL